MILENYCYTIPMLFDDAEVEQIHQHAQQYPIMEGQIGQGNQSDPDAEELDKGGETNNRIRQSDVRWCEDQLPKPLLDKLYAVDGILNLSTKKKINIPFTTIDPMQRLLETFTHGTLMQAQDHTNIMVR